MNTLSLQLRYRPLKIGWCVEPGDFDALRYAVRSNCGFWGGRANPIIDISDRAHAEQLIRLYRVDILIAASRTRTAADFASSVHHLHNPFLGDGLFAGEGGSRHGRIADIRHPLARLERERRAGDSSSIAEIAHWQEDDPLSDLILCSYGGFLPAEVTGIDYAGLVRFSLPATPMIVQPDGPLPPRLPFKYSVSEVGELYLQQHHSIRNEWGSPGFFLGRADDFGDLVDFWNIKAAGAQILFHDPRHDDRLRDRRLAWMAPLKGSGEARHRPDVALWHRREPSSEDRRLFGDSIWSCPVDPVLWNGLNLHAPVYFFGSSTSLAPMAQQDDRPPVLSFALPDRPFENIPHAFHHHYVVSVEPGIGLFGNDEATLHFPFIPELNEFYGRNAHLVWDHARVEPGSLGAITPVTRTDMRLSAIHSGKLIAAIFEAFGMKATSSLAGRVTSNLIRQMGGLDRCRVFQIGGVRSLIESYLPDQHFTRGDAQRHVNGGGVVTPLSRYCDLYIEPREECDLSFEAVFKHLLRRGVFRPGLRFKCPRCELIFWLSLDDARTRVDCEYCGHAFNAAPQLHGRNDWAYRRSGLFGRNDNQAGGVPVALTLMHLLRSRGPDAGIFTTGLDLEPMGFAIDRCEVDFVMVDGRLTDDRIAIAIGECKTRNRITEADLANLLRVAAAFPRHRFAVFIVLAKLTAFDAEELAMIRALPERERCRIIMFTQRELEPYHTYAWAKREFDFDDIVVDLAGMAAATRDIYIEPRPRPKADEEAQS